VYAVSVRLGIPFGKPEQNEINTLANGMNQRSDIAISVNHNREENTIPMGKL